MDNQDIGAVSKSKLFLVAGVSLILIILAWCGYKVHEVSAKQEQVKTDYSSANNITFGLLSASQWRDRIEDIVTKQIQSFAFTPQQQEELQKEVEQILNSLIDKAISMINKPQKSLGGKLKKAAFNIFVDADALHKQVPVFAKQIITEVNKPSSKKRLKDVAQSEIKNLATQTYDSSNAVETSVTNALYKRYHVQNAAAFDKVTTLEISELTRTAYHYSFGMLACVLFILALWRFLRQKEDLYKTLFLLSILAAVIILVVGLTTTMIEVDARIKSLDFHLMNNNVSFKNQVLFFQSKSIMDVVILLLKTAKADSILVGLLILCFSVLFPVTKLVAACIYLLSEKKWAKGKFIHYFAFKSGKWSMADVMVVAILMAYIGFNGILESQLQNLNIHNSILSSITTNNTSLQPGYIVFLGFVLFGLVLSVILKRITGEKVD